MLCSLRVAFTISIFRKTNNNLNGKIKAKEIRVEANGWPDYVFEDGYDVGKLSELERYIKVNKHLPEIPSAKEVETNGVELGEMYKNLLKKVEELTLHLIKKEKQINNKDRKLNELTGKYNELKTALYQIIKN